MEERKENPVKIKRKVKGEQMSKKVRRPEKPRRQRNLKKEKLEEIAVCLSSLKL
jgi:hypothetical protein